MSLVVVLMNIFPFMYHLASYYYKTDIDEAKSDFSTSAGVKVQFWPFLK